MFAILRKRPLVSICVPAYRAHGFLHKTIESAVTQTMSDLEIVISNDGGAPALDPSIFKAHRNIRVYNAPKRLGWVANSNLALSRARGDYFMILPHDDTLRPEYVDACLQVLRDDPHAFAAYSDIDSDNGGLTASEVRGSVVDRVRHVMTNLYNGYSFRALMRRNPKNWRDLRLRPNPPSDFCVDSTWILQQACFGELRRVPRPLYWKCFSDRSTHSGWAKLPPTQLKAAWLRHCDQMGQIAATRVADTDMIDQLVALRKDPRNVREAPIYLKTLMRDA